MQWSKQHDILLAREVLAMEACNYKKGSNEIGKKWTDIAASLKTNQEINYKPNLSQRGVRERFALLQTRFKEKEKEEQKASGISPEQDELDVLLEEICEREKVAEESRSDESKKKEMEKVTAEDIRKVALERVGQTMKRKEGMEDHTSKLKRKRRSGSDAIEFLKEKSEREMTIREQEVELNKKEQQDKANQFQVMMKAMQTQQEQQQSQNVQILMAQQNRSIMALLEKMVSKN